MRRFMLLAVAFLPACTVALWQPEYKVEQVDGFYVKRDTGQLFVTTADTAYVFEIDGEFGEALLLSREVDFSPQFEDFWIDKKNQVTGEVSLRLLQYPPPEELVARLTALGFKKGKFGSALTLTRDIKGRRYTIEGELPLQKLEKELIVRVAQPRTFAETAGKIIATPVMIAWDGYVTLPGMFLLVGVMATDSL